MTYLLIILYFIPLTFFAQEEDINFEQNVNGVLTTSNSTYLILDNGLIEVEKTNLYTEYYREIYNDSTIVNPNLELKSEFDLNIIPFILPQSKEEKIDFSDPVNIGLFLKLNESGGYILAPRVNEIIDSLLVTN